MNITFIPLDPYRSIMSKFGNPTGGSLYKIYWKVVSATFGFAMILIYGVVGTQDATLIRDLWYFPAIGFAMILVPFFLWLFDV